MIAVQKAIFSISNPFISTIKENYNQKLYLNFQSFICLQAKQKFSIIIKTVMLKQDLSTSFEANVLTVKEDNYLECIKQLKNENGYKKQALKTAESLIKQYRHENQLLKRQNSKLVLQLKYRNKEIEQLRSRIENVEPSKTKSQVFSQIKLMAERQEAYEEKIRDLESKIFLLERQNKEKDIYRNKNKIFIKTEVEPDKINEYSLFYNPKEKTKNVHKNLTQLRNLHIKMKKRNDEVGHLQQMNITTEGRYHQQTYTNVSSSSERPKTPQRYNTPKKKNKGIRNQWK